MHVSVLPHEVLTAFSDTKLSIFVDATLGAAGHASSILSAHPEIEKFIGIDQDPAAMEIARSKLQSWEKKTSFFSGNFSNIKQFLETLQIQFVDGILMDLGVSSMQLDRPEKGFSFTHNGPLDMRMDPSHPLTAEIIVNEWSQEDLGRIFREFGEEKQWRQAAKTIVEARKGQRIATTHQLADVLRPIFRWKKKGINPLTLIFQALRIQVNNELDVIQKAIPDAIDVLSSGGRLAIISFHSLEDRIVKNAFRFAASDKYETTGLGGVFRDKTPTAKILTNRPIVPTEEEVQKNPRCRSAKLRILEKL